MRTTLTTLAIIFGVMLIFGMNTVLPTMLAALQANVQGAEGNVDFTITNVSGQSFPADVANRLHGIDGVRAVSASLKRTINLPADFVDQNPAASRHADRRQFDWRHPGRCPFDPCLPDCDWSLSRGI